MLKDKTRRALDSVVLDDAVATQDTSTQLIAAVRRVHREIPAATAVIAQHCHAHDWDDPGKPRIAWDDKTARDALRSSPDRPPRPPRPRRRWPDWRGPTAESLPPPTYAPGSPATCCRRPGVCSTMPVAFVVISLLRQRDDHQEPRILTPGSTPDGATASADP